MGYVRVAEMILRYIDIAEETYKNENGKGREKKAFVMNFSKEMITNAQQVSQNDHAIAWNTVEPAISSFIDASVSLCNLFSPDSKGFEDFEWRNIVGPI